MPERISTQKKLERSASKESDRRFPSEGRVAKHASYDRVNASAQVSDLNVVPNASVDQD